MLPTADRWFQVAIENAPASQMDTPKRYLEEWLKFFLAEGHILRRHPHIIFQEAANYLDGRTIAEAAMRRWETGQERRPWFSWLSREQKAHRCVMTLNGNGECAYSPDGKQILSGSTHDDSLITWDATTGSELVRFVGHTNRITVCKYSADGSRILSGSADMTVRLWNPETGIEQFCFRGHTKEIIDCEFSLDGERLVSCSEDNTARLWDAVRGSEIATLQGHTYYVMKCKFSPDGSRIATASWDSTLRLWDGKTGEQIATLADHTDKIHDCAFSPDGQLLVSASKDGTLNVWDGLDGRIYGTLYGHRQGDACTACVFSPDGNRILSASTDFSLRLWDTWTGKTIAEVVGHTFQVDGCFYSSDGRYIVSSSADRELIVWDAETGVALATVAAGSRFCFSPDVKWLVTSRLGELKIWEINLDRPAQLLSPLNAIHECAYSPDLQTIVTASESGHLNLIDTQEKNNVEVLNGHSQAAFSVDWSADCERIVSASYDMTVRVWDVESRAQINILKAHTRSVYGCRFSPDGKRIASISFDETLQIWDAQSGEPLTIVEPGHPGGGYQCCYSIDGRRILSGGASDNVLSLLDSTSGEQITQFEHEDLTRCCGFSPDGRRVLSSSEAVHIWSMRSGDRLVTFPVGREPPLALQFSPDGKYVLVGSGDGVRICDLTGSVVVHFVADTVTALRFGPPNLIAAGDNRGEFYHLELFGLKSDIPYITAKYVYRFGNARYDDIPSVRCAWCGVEFQVAVSVVDSIKAIERNARLEPHDSPCEKLPDETWEERSLFQPCPHCDGRLRFNPFIVDQRNS